MTDLRTPRIPGNMRDQTSSVNSWLVKLTNLANTLGLYTPARDVFTQWAFGADDAFSAALTPASATDGLAMDARHINTGARTINIIAGGATNYDYQILGGRNNIIGQASNMATGTITSITTLINIPASLGYAPWLFLRLTNNSGNATYKAVLIGKGG